MVSAAATAEEEKERKECDVRPKGGREGVKRLEVEVAAAERSLGSLCAALQ